jgi:hypothetical protein
MPGESALVRKALLKRFCHCFWHAGSPHHAELSLRFKSGREIIACKCGKIYYHDTGLSTIEIQLLVLQLSDFYINSWELSDGKRITISNPHVKTRHNHQDRNVRR